MTTLRQLSIEKRTQIGQYYQDGLKPRDIAPLYGMKERDVNNTIAYLRKHGVVIPYKIKRKEAKQELLILPEETKKSSRRKYANSEKREAYRLYRTTGDINTVMNAYNVDKKIAYYMVWHGRKLSGVKGRVRVSKSNVHLDHAPTSKVKADNIGFFTLGVVVTLLVMWAI